MTEPKRCPVCSAGPAYGPLPDPTPHAAWCPNLGRAYYGPSYVPEWVRRAQAATLPVKVYSAGDAP